MQANGNKTRIRLGIRFGLNGSDPDDAQTGPVPFSAILNQLSQRVALAGFPELLVRRHHASKDGPISNCHGFLRSATPAAGNGDTGKILGNILVIHTRESGIFHRLVAKFECFHIGVSTTRTTP